MTFKEMIWINGVTFSLFLSATGLLNAKCSSNCRNATTELSGLGCNETTGECLFGCVPGKTGSDCQVPCGKNCFTCSLLSDGTEYGTLCDQCDLNYYKNESRCETCSNKCQTNSSSTNNRCRQSDGYCVFGCIKDFYGDKCDKTCNSKCLRNLNSVLPSCLQDSGKCQHGCINGYFGDQCDIICSVTCRKNDKLDVTVCRQSDGFCVQGCRDGWFGTDCSYSCSAGCMTDNASTIATCGQEDGYCDFGCLNEYYGERCRQLCSQHCHSSNISLRTCNESTGHCKFGCVSGYYRAKCDVQCNGCLENFLSDRPICDTVDGTCTYGCKEMFYGPTCEACSTSCEHFLCDRDGCCFGCRFDSRTGCNCLENCPVGCKGVWTNQRCFINGTCKDGCNIDYWGPACKPCSVKCGFSPTREATICSDLDGKCFFGCREGSYGLDCSEICPDQCRNNICNRMNGDCLDKCNRGHYGRYCNNTCSNNCPDNDCFSENGTCIAKTCLLSQYAWYGPSCEQKCPENCVQKVCDKKSGQCTKGCIEGYYGYICDNECNNGTFGYNCERNCGQGCVKGLCDRVSGECECISKYIGGLCDVEAFPDSKSSSNKASQTAIIVVPVVFGLCLTVISGIYLFKRYRNRCNEDTDLLQTGSSDLKMDIVEAVPSTSTYEEISLRLYEGINGKAYTSEHKYDAVLSTKADSQIENKQTSLDQDIYG